jgi:hypothetical protein
MEAEEQKVVMNSYNSQGVFPDEDLLKTLPSQTSLSKTN